MAIKVVGPIVKNADPDPCHTGWCDSSMPAPSDWGSPESKKSSGPKNPPKSK